MRDTPCGFRPKRSTRNKAFQLNLVRIHVLVAALENSLKHVENVYACFIDFEKACRRIRREKSGSVLKRKALMVNYRRPFFCFTKSTEDLLQVYVKNLTNLALYVLTLMWVGNVNSATIWQENSHSPQYLPHLQLKINCPWPLTIFFE